VKEVFKKITVLLSFQERRRLVALGCLITVAAFFEALGVASILPYMSLLTVPDSDVSRKVFLYVAQYANTDSRQQVIALVGVAVLIGVVGGTALSGLATWLALRFAMYRIHSMSLRVLDSYLGRDYEFFIQRHSSGLLRNLLSEVQNVVGGVLTPLIQMSTRVVVAMLLGMLLIAVNMKVALFTFGAFVAFYLGIYRFTRQRLANMGSENILTNEARYRILTELFGGIREVKLWNKERYYHSIFEQASLRFAKVNADNQLIALLPRYTLEIVAFGGMVLVTIFLAASDDNFSNFIPLLSLYAAAGYKLLPSLQQIYVNVAAIRYSSASLDALLAENIAWAGGGNKPTAIKKTIVGKQVLSNEIRFSCVHYRYPGADEDAIGPLELSLKAFQTTGIVGISGAGKSTILDLVLGLLTPSRGEIYVDGRRLALESKASWSGIIGYVPQNIFLTSGTVLENIAFGVSPEDVDMVAAYEAARAAQVYDVIDSLPDKFFTRLGERGLRLSGGQRQRIAIARALYRNPEILIFDEATSALDSETEEAVMDAVHALNHKKTIIIVTHRLSTLRDCDQIYRLERGQAVLASTASDSLDMMPIQAQ
jgi:ABC-type bacteriocin/lantibiotic exporter with double-glycine peptidase domain